MTYPQNVRTFASTRETSWPIALAIFEIADEGDENRVWQAPTIQEEAAVIARAWELADTDEEVLRWGMSKIERV